MCYNKLNYSISKFIGHLWSLGYFQRFWQNETLVDMDEEIPVQVDNEKSTFSIWSRDGHHETDQPGTQHYNATFICTKNNPTKQTHNG